MSETEHDDAANYRKPPPHIAGSPRCAIPTEDLARVGVTGDPDQPTALGRLPRSAGLSRRSFTAYISLEPDWQYQNKVIRNASVRTHESAPGCLPCYPPDSRIRPPARRT